MSKAWQRTLAFLRSLTRRYYEGHGVWLPPDFPLREFAAQLWGGKSYVRHMAFNTASAVREFLVRRAPRHFYYSSARYEQPGLDDMDAKGWRSADIVFDIDADHLPLCIDKLVKLESPVEGETSLLPDECIKPAAEETVKLYDALVEELGFEERSIKIEFSGHRGFHVTVYLGDSDERARAGQEYRRELVNYLRAVGVREETLWPHRALRLRRPALPVPPLTWMAGLRGRLAREAYRILSARGAREAALALTRRDPVSAAELYSRHRDLVDDALREAGERLGIEVDAQVTVDTRRLVRAPGSINGKTGMIVEAVSRDGLADFTVSEELSAFHGAGEARIHVLTDIPAMQLLGYRVRLRRGDRPKLPMPLAGLLMAKGLAVLAAE